MTEYLVTFTASAKKELKDLPSEVIGRLLPRIRELPGNPRPGGCKKLHGYKNCWRIRVGNYRVVYAVDDASKAVGHQARCSSQGGLRGMKRQGYKSGPMRPARRPTADQELRPTCPNF